MNFKFHLLVGVIAGMVILFLLNLRSITDPILCLSVLAAAAIGAVFPDIDHQKSKPHKFLEKVLVVCCFLLMIVILFFYPELMTFLGGENTLPNIVFVAAVASVVLYVVFNIFLPRHRGLIHNPIFLIVFGVIIFFVVDYFANDILFSFYVASAFVCGAISHLLTDMF